MERGLTFEQYETLQVLMYKVLVDPFDLDDARHCASNDWVTDCGEPSPSDVASRSSGQQIELSLGRIQFMDAVFEIADMCAWPRAAHDTPLRCAPEMASEMPPNCFTLN